MDEADKYKQRLEAIAEKRRLQEEQERAKRELEDEKLRLQQLKRKSLRDQWLMEGAPLSPTSSDVPRSTLWSSQAQEIENRIDGLQSESQRLAEEEERLEEQMEGGQTNAANLAEVGAEIVQDAVVQNGGNDATGSETTEDEVRTNQSPQVDETAAVLTNGGGHLEADTNHDASEQSNVSTTNGPVVASEGVITVKLEPGLSVSEAESGHVPNVNINEEEEDGTLVMRAERVIITDEGDDAPEDVTPQEDQQEAEQSEETHLPNPDTGKEGGEAVEEAVETEAAPAEATEPTKEAQPATEDGDVQGDMKANDDGDEGTKAEGQDKQSEDPTSTVQVHFPADTLEGTTVAPVPVYSEAQPSALTPKLEAEGEAATSAVGEAATSAVGEAATSAGGEAATSAGGEAATSAEGEAATSPEGTEVAVKAHDPAPLPGQFQDVPLADPQENQRTGAGEQEPLLSQAKTPSTPAEPAAASSPANTETYSPTRASQGEEAEAPKRKACQCCSVM